MRPMNLNPLRRFVEAQMTDTILVQRPGRTADDATWDDVAGEYVETAGKPTPIYNGADVLSGFPLAKVSSKGWTPQEQVSAGQAEIVTTDIVCTPIGTVPFIADDIITVLASLRSEVLVGMKFIVIAPIASSSEIQQKVLVTVWDGKRPR